MRVSIHVGGVGGRGGGLKDGGFFALFIVVLFFSSFPSLMVELIEISRSFVGWACGVEGSE